MSESDIDFAIYPTKLRTQHYDRDDPEKLKQYKKLEAHIQHLASTIFKQQFIQSAADLNKAIMGVYITGLYHGAELGGRKDERTN